MSGSLENIDTKILVKFHTENLKDSGSQTFFDSRLS
jgi:hypothetical protein